MPATFQDLYAEAIEKKAAVRIEATMEPGEVSFVVIVLSDPTLWLGVFDTQQECIDFCTLNELPYTLAPVPEMFTAAF